jgi:hypothetical protein
MAYIHILSEKFEIPFSMRILFLFLPIVGVVASLHGHSQPGLEGLPLWEPSRAARPRGDWLLGEVDARAGVFRSPDGRDIVLCNGLVKRVFRIRPNVACTDLTNLVNGQQLLRSVSAEARLTIDGREFRVGGLQGVRERAYLLPGWVDGLTASEEDFRLKGVRVGRIADVHRPSRAEMLGWAAPGTDRAWIGTYGGIRRPSGITLSFDYGCPAAEAKGLLVTVHYELHDGIPLMVKWMEVRNPGAADVVIGKPVHEVLALVEEESAVVGSPEQMKKQHGIYVETNYAFNNAMRYDISDQTTHWRTDSLYTSQVNYNYQTPCILEVYPEKVASVRLRPGESFVSARTCELLMDGYDRERRGLAIRKMYRCIAPWVTENPIFMHLVSRGDDEVRRAVDQCVATGYEAVILSFGSHLNMEDTTRANLERWKALADYAHARKVLIGGYSLFSSRRISDEDDVIDPVTGRPDAAAFFGHAPCMGSRWGLAYLGKLRDFFTHTGFDLFENDGPYPGDVCASRTHPGHEGLGDSQWRQMELQKGLYRWMLARGIYINAPDWYFLDGTNKIAIGYRETNFSLSREQQRILNRQNIYDGTWEKTPSMGWGFVPLVRYQGGGPEAVLEPLSEHLEDYRELMVQYYGAGVQACYRGPRIFDTEATRSMVSGTLAWYRKYRGILNADIIHLRRADGRDWDGILHVDPSRPTCGLMMLYNPLDSAITRVVRVPAYYTGLKDAAWVSEGEGPFRPKRLDREYAFELQVRIPARSHAWYRISGGADGRRSVASGRGR